MGYRINRIRLEFKVDVAATLKSPQIVLIESDWNLKHEEGIAFSNFDDGINRIRLEFKEVLQDALLSVLSCINRIRLEFKVDTNVFSKYCW